MPLDDPRQVTSLDEAFDLSTPGIHFWELQLIWQAVILDLVRLDAHARQAARDDSIPRPEIDRVILSGVRRSKDIHISRRQAGINFEGRIAGGRWLRVKVSWFVGYVVVTVHTL